MPVAQLAHGFQIEAEAITELHRAQRYHARPRVDQLAYIGHADASGVRLNPAQLDPLFGQAHPAIDVRRILDIRDDDVVSGPPVEPIRNGNQAFGRVLYEGNLIVAGTDQRSDPALDFRVGLAAPIGII